MTAETAYRVSGSERVTKHMIALSSTKVERESVVGFEADGSGI
jgi:hypothetical protein